MVTTSLDSAYWSDPEPDWRGSPVDDGLREFGRGDERLRHHVLFRTSGSTGIPRWVALSKAALRWSAARVNEHLRCGAGDCWGCALPTEHVGGYGVLARASVAGGRVALFLGKWSAQGFVQFCRNEKVTVTSLVPAQVYDIANAGLHGPSSLRRVVVGGGALSEELAQQARMLGWPVQASYGMTETASQIATETGEDRLAAEGLPLIIPWEARVDGDGRICVRGGGLLSYYAVPQGTGWVLERPVDAEGWFRTDDLGRMSAPGRLVVTGRAGRMVKILGELVSLDRLDRIWEEVCGAAGEAVLAALPDERRGFAIAMVTSGREPARLGRWKEMFDERVAPYERIQQILHVPEIPRTPLGKVRNEALGRMINQLGTSDEGGAPDQPG